MQLRALRERLHHAREVGPESGETPPSIAELRARGVLVERPAPANDNSKLFSSSDYEAGELITHAQSCIWICDESHLAEALLTDVKPHNRVGAQMLGIDYVEFQKRYDVKEKICVDARQAAKPLNFGLPGGIGPVKICLQQRMQGPNTPHASGPHMVENEDGDMVRGYKGLRFCLLVENADYCGGDKIIREWNRKKVKPVCGHCVRVAAKLKKIWLETWPENNKYFAFIDECVAQGMTITAEILALWPHLADVFEPNTQLAPGEIMQHVSGRVRGGLIYTSAANGFFQGLLADAAKAAYRQIGRECYDRTYRVPLMLHGNSLPSRYAGAVSPLLGSRPTAFFHDEIFCEHPHAVASDAAMRVAEIMIDYLRFYCPDLADACMVEPALQRRWLKAAKSVWVNAAGSLTRPDGKKYKRGDMGVHLVPWEPEPLLVAAA